MQGLGRLFDIGTCFAPVDIDTNNGWTGKRISMANARGLTFVYFTGVAASGTDDLTFTVKQHTAYTSGTSNNLASATVSTSTGITEWFVKTETALDNDESWARVTQSEAATITFTGTTYAANQSIVAVYIDADQLGDGYTHLSVDGALTTSAVRLGCGLYILHDLNVQRKPANLGNLLNIGAANA